MEKLERLTISAQAAQEQEAVHHITNIHAKICQPCLCCKNTRELPEGFYSISPWVCDECKDAIALVKDFIAENCGTSKDCLEKETPNENIYPI